MAKRKRLEGPSLPPIVVCGLGYGVSYFRPLRFKHMGYAMITDGLWQHVVKDEEDGSLSQVGPHYKTKIELLADSHRYCMEYGAEPA